MNRKIFHILILALLVFAAGCGPKGGIYHRVKKGENLWRICYTYKVDLQEVAELNNIEDTTTIKAGDLVFIPGAKKQKEAVPPKTNNNKKTTATTKVANKKTGTVNNSKRTKVAKTGSATKITLYKGRLAWPVKGKVIKKYGMHGSTMNQGIDIAAPKGTPVKASAEGVVAFVASTRRGLGNFIILKHSDKLYTVYAYNDINLVKKNDKVQKGAVIAKVGNSGNAGTYSTHFEVRDGSRTRNPLFYLK